MRRLVSEPMAGLMRLQWWRDALEGLAAGRPLAHPVVEALHARWARFAPLRSRLDAAIDAREQELGAGPPADLAALEDRLASSWGEITLGALELLGAAEGPARAAGRHLGLSLGLVRLLQTLPGEQSKVIELAYYGGFTHTQIAEMLDMPVGTVKGRMRLGLEKMRRELTGEVA